MNYNIRKDNTKTAPMQQQADANGRTGTNMQPYSMPNGHFVLLFSVKMTKFALKL